MSTLHLKIGQTVNASPSCTLAQNIPSTDTESVSYIPAGETQRVTALLDWENGDYGRETPLFLNLNEPTLGWQDSEDEEVVHGTVVPVHVAHIAVTLDKAPRLENDLADLMRDL